MQSSTAIAFRALVMLIVLISVPLIALFGKDLPDVIKGVMEGRGLVLGPPKPAANSEGLATPPAPTTRWSDSGPYRAPAPSRMDAGAASPAAAVPPAATTMPAANTLADFGELPSARARDEGSRVEPVPPGAGAVPLLAAPAGDGGGLNAGVSPSASVYGGGAPGSAVTQAAGQSAPVEWRTGPAQGMNSEGGIGNAQRAASALADFGELSRVEPVAPRAEPVAPGVQDGPARLAGPTGAGPTPDGEQFRWAEKRLRELGATHYMLETWGPENNRYRFVCQMAIGGNPGINRYFQAVDDDPLQAMEGVLKQVEEWRTQGP